MPLEYGGQRPPTSQWTVTGCGALIISSGGAGPRVTGITPGVITDAGITDANNMGAAMAPAARDTLTAHFEDFGRTPSYYDLIVTGDLGFTGADLLRDLCRRDGVELGSGYTDCGMLIFDREKQDVHSGGSGCGCSASVLSGYILNGMRSGRWKKVLLSIRRIRFMIVRLLSDYFGITRTYYRLDNRARKKTFRGTDRKFNLLLFRRFYRANQYPK